MKFDKPKIKYFFFYTETIQLYKLYCIAVHYTSVTAKHCVATSFGQFEIEWWVRIPAGTAGEFSSPGSTFCADSYFGIRSTPVLPQ